MTVFHAVRLPKRARFQTATREPDNPCNGPALWYLLDDSHGCILWDCRLSPLKPILAGLSVTILQIALAVLILAPEGSFSQRYSTLVQHDSYWFMNIVNRGYQTIVPPIDHKVMEVSNVAFFPAYPLLAGALRYGFGIDASGALLLVAQTATVGFWTYFFLFCQRWNLSSGFQIAGTWLFLLIPPLFSWLPGIPNRFF